MDQKVLLFLVVMALVGIAYYVRFKPHRTHGATSTAETATASPPPAKPSRKKEQCDFACVSAWTRCGTQCDFGNTSCSSRCEQTKDRCMAACR